MVKHAFSFLALLFISLCSYSQYDDISSGWTKKRDRIKINTKMDELIKRVSFETECNHGDITYMVVDKYQFFGLKRDHLNFPKTIIVKACENTYTYINFCSPEPDGKLNNWVKGTWILNSSSKKE